MTKQTKTKQTSEVPCLFRAWPDGGVVALFPTIPAEVSGPAVMSYERVGQHGSADLQGVVWRTRPATPEQYAPLLRELTGAPFHYELRVVKRATRAMQDALRAAQAAVRSQCEEVTP